MTSSEERETTYGPALVAAGLVLTSVALTIQPILSAASLALVALGAARWRHEVRGLPVQPAEERLAEDEGGGAADDAWQRPSVVWWGSFGFGIVHVVVMAAAYRTLVAHEVLAPGASSGASPVRAGVWTTALVLALGLAALDASRQARAADAPAWRRALPLGVAAALALAVALLAAAQAAAVAVDVPARFGGGAASAMLWLFALHACAFAAVGMAVAGLVWRTATGRMRASRWGPTAVVLPHAWIAIAAWVFTFFALHLGLVSFSKHLI